MEGKNLLFRTKQTFNLRGRLWTLDRPVVMGIVNTTPDSFYAGSRVQTLDTALRQAEKMLSEGATILDVGGYSTRPGAAQVAEEEEKERIVPVVEAIVQHFPQVIVSVDTFRARVAEAAVLAGARLVNDVSGGTDPEMIETVAQLQVPYVLMHSRGTPQTMTQLTQYTDLLRELLDFFVRKLEMLRQSGIKDVVIDPGFGFAKTIEQNFYLLQNLAYFQVLELPLLVGLSRKSTIYKTLHITSEDALNGTTVLNTIALARGASILRVHDVKQAIECIQLHTALLNSGTVGGATLAETN